MDAARNAAEVAKAELLPLLHGLRRLAREEGQPEQEDFFARVHAAVAAAREPEDLADPFMQLSTSAFLGFEYGPLATMLLDRALELAQRVSTTLSASAEEVH